MLASGAAASAGAAVASGATHARVPNTTITIDGARPGPVFDGIGAISGGGGTARLLIDYPQPQRSQILSYLFKPGYGADLQMLKLEIGGDAEATDGSEPSFEHTPGHVNCAAGYEMWLARQARKLNPRIALYALQWSAPGWVGHAAERAWTQTDISYLLRWLGCARRLGLKINYLGGWNEHLPHGRMTTAIVQWFIDLRRALDSHGYRAIKIVAADADRRPSDVSGFVHSVPAFRRAIGVLGYHDICGYPPSGLRCQVPLAATSSGKPVWASEVGDLHPPGGPAALARSIDNSFIQARATALLEYPLVTAMPGGMVEEDLGLVSADQPWSGSYQVNPALWVIAQTTQFTQAGWRYVRG
jgi:hypothetical protein